MLYTSNTFVPYNYPLEEADVVFLGIPFVSTSISKPALYGPLIVRESLKIKEDYLDGINIFGSLKVCDLGNLEVVPGSYELTAERIRNTIDDIRTVNKKAFLIFIGGEHLISLPIIESLKPKSVLQLDAHADCRPDYLGNPYMHQTWAWHAAKISKIFQMGVQTMAAEEVKAAKELGITMLDTKEKLKLVHPSHLTIDIDVIANMNTGFPEGILSPENVYQIVKNSNVSSMDITEIADYSLPSKTGFIAAEIIKSVLVSVIKRQPIKIKQKKK